MCKENRKGIHPSLIFEKAIILLCDVFSYCLISEILVNTLCYLLPDMLDCCLIDSSIFIAWAPRPTRGERRALHNNSKDGVEEYLSVGH